MRKLITLLSIHLVLAACSPNITIKKESLENKVKVVQGIGTEYHLTPEEVNYYLPLLAREADQEEGFHYNPSEGILTDIGISIGNKGVSYDEELLIKLEENNKDQDGELIHIHNPKHEEKNIYYWPLSCHDTENSFTRKAKYNLKERIFDSNGYWMIHWIKEPINNSDLKIKIEEYHRLGKNFLEVYLNYKKSFFGMSFSKKFKFSEEYQKLKEGAKELEISITYNHAPFPPLLPK